MKQTGRIGLKTILMLGLGAIIIVFIFIFLANRQGSNPNALTDTVASFINAASERDGEASYILLSDNFKGRVSKGAWQVQLDNLFANPDNTPEYVSTEMLNSGEGGQPESRRLRYTIILTLSERETPYYMDLIMVKIDDSWKVNSMDIRKQ